MARVVLVAAATTAALFSAADRIVWAQTNFGAPMERNLKLDWQGGERGGRPVVTGHVFNDHGFGARDIRVLVESLDVGGHVVARTVGYVPFLITPGTTGSFEVRVPEKAFDYRVSIVSVRWVLPDDEPFFRRF